MILTATAVADRAKRVGDWMQTYTGRQYWPADPRASEVDIQDIAAALSKQTRYGGHCIWFYCVAEHCVLIARRLAELGHPRDVCFAALMHDASEAYLVDVPRPIKGRLGGYAEIENLNMLAIAERYGFLWPMPAIVKEADSRILLDEQAQNMALPPADWNVAGPPLGVRLKFWSPTIAAREFVSAFVDFGGAA
ncbi:MAG: hypothetical protein OJF48_003424 [Afipia sp.]|jgi:hypothetical protein|nr:MAG: hypothetical protein OJF48_003424 [Afipia sp.]